MDISESVELCKRKARTARAVETARAYSNAINLFLAYLHENGIETSSPLSAINIEHFVEFSEWIAAGDYSRSTMQVYASGVKYYFRYLVIKKVLEPTYSETIRYQDSWHDITRKRESKLPRFPGINDVDKMREAVRSLKQYKSPIYERNIAIVELLASSGCRNKELCTLKVEDFAEDFQSVIVTGKGSAERRIFISKNGKESLVHYWSVRGYKGKDHPAFARHDKGAGKKILPLTMTSIRSIVRDVAMVAGIEVFSPHYFRHAFAIKILRETGNLALTQDLLGHKSPVSTRVYAKIYDDDLKEYHREVFG